jgi:hypothetical protein
MSRDTEVEMIGGPLDGEVLGFSGDNVPPVLNWPSRGGTVTAKWSSCAAPAARPHLLVHEYQTMIHGRDQSRLVMVYRGYRPF